MPRARVLSQKVVPYPERKFNIENEPLPMNIGELLDLAASQNNESPAIHFFEKDVPISYGELCQMVNQLANGLLSRGVTKGSHVGVMIPNIRQFPITWLALARIGAVMVPINIAYTGRELKYVIEDSEAEWLVIHNDCLAAWNDLAEKPGTLINTNIFVIDPVGNSYSSWHSLLKGQPSTSPENLNIGLEDLMSIQYTSGTTGFPKGCMLTHRYWLTSGKQNALRDGHSYKRILASTPFFYMDPQWQFLMTMYHGGCLYVAKRQSASRFMSWVRTYKINFALMPDVVLKQPPLGDDANNELIRVNIYGLSEHNHALLEERFDVCAREAFGMTEIGTGLFMPIEAVEMIGTGSCGVPVPFREARVADSDGHDVPDGEIGELLIRGSGIMKGYYNKPAATAAAFHGDWFRTGDLFRRDERGYFYIVGRLKEMIRRAGENIASRELESVLMSFPDIVEATVVPVKDEIRGEEVKAYIVPQPGIDPNTILDSIIDHCKNNLAPFKIPRYFEFRERLIKTASGKISKPALISEKPDLRSDSYDRVSGSWF